MTDTDRYTFDANGYLVIEEALNPVKISAMNEALDSVPLVLDQEDSNTKLVAHHRANFLGCELEGP